MYMSFPASSELNVKNVSNHSCRKRELQVNWKPRFRYHVSRDEFSNVKRTVQNALCIFSLQ